MIKDQGKPQHDTTEVQLNVFGHALLLFAICSLVIVLAKDTKASAENTIKGNREEIHSLA
jgi:hypothetical protein